MPAIVKPSKTVKTSASIMRQTIDAMDRARDIYLGQIKRAEAEYFERIRQITVAVATPDESNGASEAIGEAPSATA